MSIDDWAGPRQGLGRDKPMSRGHRRFIKHRLARLYWRAHEQSPLFSRSLMRASFHSWKHIQSKRQFVGLKA